MKNLIPKANDKAINMMETMLNFNPLKRPSASQCLQHPFFQCHDVLSLMGLQLNYTLQNNHILNRANIGDESSDTPNKNQNSIELVKTKNTYNSNLSNFINIKKNTLPRIEINSGRTTQNLITTNNQNNKVKYSIKKENTNFNSNCFNTCNANKVHKAKIEDFMSNYFKN